MHLDLGGKNWAGKVLVVAFKYFIHSQNLVTLSDFVASFEEFDTEKVFSQKLLNCMGNILLCTPPKTFSRILETGNFLKHLHFKRFSQWKLSWGFERKKLENNWRKVAELHSTRNISPCTPFEHSEPDSSSAFFLFRLWFSS